MTIKYLLCPGTVQSMHNGELHYISAKRLAELYGVARHECVVFVPSSLCPSIQEADALYPGLIHLHPQYDGDYRLPAGAEKEACCPRCGASYRPGIALESTVRGVPDFRDGYVITMSPGGPGHLVKCLKCPSCGHIVTAPPESAP